MGIRFDLCKAHHSVVAIGDLLYWKPDSQMGDDDVMCFYSGDYTDVLDMNDPLIVEALAQQEKDKSAA